MNRTLAFVSSATCESMQSSASLVRMKQLANPLPNVVSSPLNVPEGDVYAETQLVFETPRFLNKRRQRKGYEVHLASWFVQDLSTLFSNWWKLKAKICCMACAW